jgi:hypothetical protein
LHVLVVAVVEYFLAEELVVLLPLVVVLVLVQVRQLLVLPILAVVVVGEHKIMVRQAAQA